MKLLDSVLHRTALGDENMLHIATASALALVDIQQRLMPQIYNRDSVVKEAVRLGKIANLIGIPIIGTEQNPSGLGENVQEIKSILDRTLIKHHFDACKDSLVEAFPNKPSQVVVAGCEAHVCVLQTAMGLLQRGIKVTIVTDAIGSRTEENINAAINRLAAAGATLATVEMIAFEWLETSNHPRFRDVLALVR